MSYGDFDVRKVIDLLGYRVEETPFIGEMRPEPPSPRLVGALDLLRGAIILGSEKSRSESLIAPILSEAAVRSHTRLFSGESFDVDAERGLSGQVDFLFARKAPGKTIVDPVLCLVEAKKADIDSKAYGQCMATMIAAQKFNKERNPIYGSVTTGSDWQFLRLREDLIEIDPTVYYERDTPTILGILLSFLGSPPAG
jgi:hypothetical protein